MTNVKFEDIILWFIMTALIAITIFIATSELIMSGTLKTSAFKPRSFPSIQKSSAVQTAPFKVRWRIDFLIWKKIFTIEKNTAISFVKMKNDINNKHNELKNLIKEK